MATIPENKRRTSTSTARGGAGAGAGRTAQTTLEITDQPKDVFFKDEGGKSNYLTTGVRLPVETLRASGPLQLRCALHYESGKRVEERDQAILNLLGNEFEPITLSADEPETTIDFRLEKVSRRKDNQRFKVLIEPDYEAMGATPRSPIAGAMTSAISVLSKRKTGQRMVSKRARPVTPGCHGCDGRAAAEETAASVEELRLQVATLQSGMDEVVAFARTQAETIAKLEALVTAALTGARYVRMTSASAPLAMGAGAGAGVHGTRGAAAHRDSQAEAEAAMPSPMRGGSGGGGGGGISGASGSGGRGPKGSGTDAGGPSVGAGAGAGAGAAAPGGSYGSLLAPDPVDRAVSTATTASEREEKILLSSLFPVGLDGASAAGGAGGAAGGGGAGDISMSAALGKWPSISAYLAPAISGSGGAAGLAGLLSSATATPGGSDADTVDESEGGEMRRPSLKRIRSKELELTFHFGTPSMPVRSRMPLAAVAGSAATHTTAGASASASASAAAAAPTTTTTTTTTSQVPSGKRTRTRPVPFEA